jgi:hypothetical protein
MTSESHMQLIAEGGTFASEVARGITVWERQVRDTSWLRAVFGVAHPPWSPPVYSLRWVLPRRRVFPKGETCLQEETCLLETI